MWFRVGVWCRELRHYGLKLLFAHIHTDLLAYVFHVWNSFIVLTYS